jgi:hypothetical protein
MQVVTVILFVSGRDSCRPIRKACRKLPIAPVDLEIVHSVFFSVNSYLSTLPVHRDRCFVNCAYASGVYEGAITICFDAPAAWDPTAVA